MSTDNIFPMNEIKKLNEYYCSYIDNERDLSRIEQLIKNEFYPFCFSLDFSPEWIDKICYNGYFPMSENIQTFFEDADRRFVVLLIKYHRERAVLDINKLLINKSVARYAKNLVLTIDKDYAGCINGIWETHGESWLYEELARTFNKLYRTDNYKTRVYSIELWDKNTGELVAGELGYKVGGLYTSLSGFRRRNSCGSVQLALLGKILKSCGIDYWDFGMAMQYKLNLGAEVLSRNEFVEILNRYKDEKRELLCDGVYASDLL